MIGRPPYDSDSKSRGPQAVLGASPPAITASGPGPDPGFDVSPGLTISPHWHIQRKPHCGTGSLNSHSPWIPDSAGNGEGSPRP